MTLQEVALVEFAASKLESWIHERRLPMGPEAKPWLDEWWSIASGLFVHSVRLSKPLPIDVAEPEVELESLFRDIVAPKDRPRRERARADGEITRCLGHELAERLRVRCRVPAVGDGAIVTRGVQLAGTWVVLEGMSLQYRPNEAIDTVTGRLLRIRDAIGHGEFFVGYVPPTHKNGEMRLIKWLEDETSAQAFDLYHQGPEFRTAVAHKLDTLEKQPCLPLVPQAPERKAAG